MDVDDVIRLSKKLKNLEMVTKDQERIELPFFARLSASNIFAADTNTFQSIALQTLQIANQSGTPARPPAGNGLVFNSSTGLPFIRDPSTDSIPLFPDRFYLFPNAADLGGGATLTTQSTNPVLAFTDANIYASWSINLGGYWIGRSLSWRFHWMITTGSGNAHFRLELIRIRDGVAVGSSVTDSANMTVTAPATNTWKRTDSGTASAILLSSANWNGTDAITLRLNRVNDAADTLASTLYITAPMIYIR